jgi:glucose/arabinose dehydrogenase
MASLEMTFYSPAARVPGQQFPPAYRGVAFAAQHGSWNRRYRVGYKVISVPVRNGRPTGEYDDFMTGFVTSEGTVWGRPVGVAVGKDGALFVTDDGSDSVWCVSYHG